LRVSHLEAPIPLNRGDISGDLSDFSSACTTLLSVKRTEECDESHVDRTAPLYNEHSSSLHLSHLEALIPLNRGDISGQSTRFSSAYTALRAVKETQEGDESHVDLTQHCGKSPVTTNTVLHCI
jgi:hypothetical protein